MCGKGQHIPAPTFSVENSFTAYSIQRDFVLSAILIFFHSFMKYLLLIFFWKSSNHLFVYYILNRVTLLTINNV